MANEMLETELLKELLMSCQLLTNQAVRFEIIQFSSLSCTHDVLRELTILYDSYVGNENYIHILTIEQMASYFYK